LDDTAERDHIGFNTRDAADHCCASDAHELVDRRRAANDSMVRNADMAAHHRIVGNDNMVAQPAIMRDVHDRHQHAVGADAGNAGAGRGAAVDRAMLTYQRAGADFAARRFAFVFEILWRQTNGTERK